MPNDTPLHAEHLKAGATLGVFFDSVLPERFTDTQSEYRMGRHAAALVDRNHQAFVYLDGPDRVRYLNAVVTNNIKDLLPGQGSLSLLLNSQGHILTEIETFVQSDRLLTASPRMVRERTVATLDKYIIMDDVVLDDATDRLGALAVEGPNTAAVVRELCGFNLDSLEERDHTTIRIGSITCQLVRRSIFGEAGAEFLAGRGDLTMLWQTLLGAVRHAGGGPIGYAALNALRIEAGVPWFGYDFNEKYIPHEAGLETTHLSYTKGCYTGQEIVERVRSRGHVNRRRAGFQFAGPKVPEAGTKLLVGGQEVGQITSVAYSPKLGRTIGMGYVRRENHAVGSLLEWAGGTAEVSELPFYAASRIQALG